MASHVVAAAEGIPERFLLKVLRPLVSARILHSLKGPNGGYRLARSADRISLLDVIEAVDSPLRGVVPELDGQGKDKLDKQLREACNRTAELVRQRLRKVTVQDLAARKG
jgi:Rrf2 family protein